VVLEVAGVKNALSKSLGSNNKTNAAYATIEALQKLVPASQWVTRTSEQKAASAKTEKAEATVAKVEKKVEKTEKTEKKAPAKKAEA
jgi:ribosomal protein S5